MAIRSNHGVWLAKCEKVRANKWREFEHIGWENKAEKRYIREIIYGKKGSVRYWDFPGLIVLINEFDTLRYLVYSWDIFSLYSA